VTSPIRIQSEGPLTVVSYYGKATDAQYQAYLDEMTKVVERNKKLSQRLVVINDTSRWMDSNANQRRMQADWIAQHAHIMRTKTAGVAFVIKSVFVRGGLTAVLWLTNMPCPYRTVATLEEALDWSKELQQTDFPARFARGLLAELEQERVSAV